MIAQNVVVFFVLVSARLFACLKGVDNFVCLVACVRVCLYVCLFARSVDVSFC